MMIHYACDTGMGMLSIISFKRRVSKSGNSLYVLLPSNLRVDADTLYVYIDEDGVIRYSINPPPGKVRYFEKVRIRIQTRVKGKEYYAITVPARIAEAAGIKRNDIVILEVLPDGFALRKAEEKD